MGSLKEKLLEAYKKNYKENPEEYTGACRISRQLGLSEEEHGDKYWGTHGLLLELKKEGYLEQKKGDGFRYIANDKVKGE